MNMECKDKNCPEHGTLSTRGTAIDGIVVSDKMQGTVIVLRDRLVKVKKYDRYRRSRSRIPAHNPPCINAKQDDAVRIVECRKLAKTVSFVVTEKLKRDDGGKRETQEAAGQVKPTDRKREDGLPPTGRKHAPEPGAKADSKKKAGRKPKTKGVDSNG